MHLIKKHQLNVYDIPIALITEQYLEYLDLMQELNLDLASEFLVMAATLIHIKSRMLLPRPDPAPGDPRTRKTRATRWCAACSSIRRSRRRPSCCTIAKLYAAPSGRAPTPESRRSRATTRARVEVDLFSLLSAFRLVLERARERPPIALPAEQIPVETRIEQLLERLSETEACGFDDLFEDAATRADMIVTFLALLEMIRLKLMRVFQAGQLGPFGSTNARGLRRAAPDSRSRR